MYPCIYSICEEDLPKLKTNFLKPNSSPKGAQRMIRFLSGGLKFLLPFILTAMISTAGDAQDPCNAHRWQAGDGWRFNSTTNKWESVTINGQAQPKGIVRCESSAETESGLEAFKQPYSQSSFPINTTLTNCFNQDDGTRNHTVSGPTDGEDIVWFNFDIRPLAGTYQFQIVTNQSIGWVLYYVDPNFAGPPAANTSTGTYPEFTNDPNNSKNLSGDCSKLIYADCGLTGNGWSTITVPSFTKPSNYYLAMWSLTGTTIPNNANLVFKARFGCGGSTCFLEKDGNDVLSCTANGYTACATFNGSAGRWRVVDNATPKATSYTVTTYDQFGNIVSTSNSTDLTANPLFVELGTVDGTAPQNDIKATICATYGSGNNYNISLSPEGKPADASNDYVACTSSGSFSGTGLTALTAAGTPTSPVCGQTNGSIAISNFDASITYTLLQGGSATGIGQVGGVFSNVPPGTYQIQATKAGSCDATSGNIVVNNPPSNLSAAGTPTSPVCGQTTGSIAISNFDATITYTLLQGGSATGIGQVGGVFSTVPPGTYQIQATKAGSCDATSGNIVVNNPPSNLSAAGTPTSPGCGQTIGSIAISNFDATITYTLLQGGSATGIGQVGGVFSNVPPGTYQIRATKAGSCDATSGNIVVNNPPSNLTAAGTPTSPGCGQTTGSIAISNFDATITYTLLQGGSATGIGQVGGVFSNVPPGTYQIRATKAGSCDATSGNIVVNNPPSNLTAAGTPTSPVCGQTNGSIAISNFDATITYTLLQGGSATGIGQVGGVFSNVPPGTYQIQATKAGSCDATSGNIVVNNPPSNLSAAGTPTSPVCGQTTGSIAISNFDATITYTLLQGGSATGIGQVGGVFSNVPPGTYQIRATKAGSCDATSGNIVVNNPPSNLTAAGTPTSPGCLQTTGGIAISNFDATITYTLLQGGNPTGIGQVGGVFSPVPPGTYQIRATKAGSCDATSGNIVVNNPPSNLTAAGTPTSPGCGQTTGSIAISNFDATITYTLLQGGSPTGIPQVGGVFSNVPPGTYQIRATKAGSCDASSANIVVNNPPITCTKFCTYTQGFYGNKNGLARLNQGLLSDPLTVGFGVNTVTIPAGATTQLNNVMPGGGTPNVLSGACTLGNPCFNAYLTKQGKINNVLLSQTITLALNMRGDANLASFPIQSGYITTSGGGCRSIPSNVVNYLISQGKATVSGLLELANKALGRVAGLPALGDINSSVSAINEVFDECKTFTGYLNYCPAIVLRAANADVPETLVSKLSVGVYPNPYRSTVRFIIQSPVAGQASLVVYNALGQKVRNVYQGHVVAGKNQPIDFTVPLTLRSNLVYVLDVQGLRLVGQIAKE